MRDPILDADCLCGDTGELPILTIVGADVETTGAVLCPFCGDDPDGIL